MSVLVEGVALLRTEPLWSGPTLPFGPTLGGPTGGGPIDPNPFDPGPQVGGVIPLPPNILVLGSLGCPAALTLESTDALYAFSGLATTIPLVTVRAANNGRVIAWGERDTWAQVPAADYALVTAWVDGNNLAIAAYAANASPVISRFSSSGGTQSSISLAKKADGCVAGWLESTGPASGQAWRLMLLETSSWTDPSTFSSSVAYGPEVVPASTPGFEAGWKYLALAHGADGASACVTQFDNSSNGALPEQDGQALLLAGGNQEWLRTAPTARAYTFARTSDASVDTSPDGITRVLAWEQQENEPGYPFPEGNPIACTHAFLCFRIDRVKGVKTSIGPFHVKLNGDWVEGGDVCIRALDRKMFLSFQGRAGNVFLLTLDHTVDYTEAPEWAPLGVPGASIDGHDSYDPPIESVAAPFYPDAYVGPGWLSNLDCRTIDGHDVVVMTWEHSTSQSLVDNETKQVAIAAFAEPNLGPIAFSAGMRIDVPPNKGDTVYFHLAPGITVAPEEECRQLGHIRLDLSYFDVRRSSAPYGATHDGQLVHSRVAWCVPWLG